MNWNKGKKDSLKNIEQVNLNKWVLNLSQKDYTPVEHQESIDGREIVDDNDTQYLPVIIEELPSVDVIKNALLRLQDNYDKSDEVNIFFVNGISDWMDKNTRNSLKETLNVVERSGESTYILWLADTPLTLPIEYIRQFLDQLELYAIACYQVTSQHLSKIQHIQTEEGLFSYDISDGYPEKINLVLPMNEAE